MAHPAPARVRDGTAAEIFRSGWEFFMKKLYVLVVDDELLIRWSVSEALSAAGHVVVQASDGRSALAALSTMADVDVVLLDYRLPDSDGLELLKKIRTNAPGATVVMMTAYGTPEMIQEALSLGAKAVMAKPFDMHDVDGVLRTAHGLNVH